MLILFKEKRIHLNFFYKNYIGVLLIAKLVFGSGVKFVFSKIALGGFTKYFIATLHAQKKI